MSNLERMDIMRDQTPQTIERPLAYGEAIIVEPGQRIIIDDLSNERIDYSGYVRQIADENPGIIPLESSVLNKELSDLLHDTVGALPNGSRTEPYDKSAITYIFPGGGGKRLRESLNRWYDTPNFLDIGTQRDPNNRNKAFVSEQSQRDLSALSTDKAQTIVIFDDAIKNGGTLDTIITTIRSNPNLKNANIIAATQVRFAKSTEYASGYVNGVNGCTTVAAKIVVGEDPNDPNESAPLTYLSSFLKKLPPKDGRLKAIAGDNDEAYTRLIQAVGDAKRQYLCDNLPRTPSFRFMTDMLTKITDRSIMKRLLGDLLTSQEIQRFPVRTATAALLLQGRTPAEIAAHTIDMPVAGEETAERIQEWCEYGHKGYAGAIERYRATRAPKQGDRVLNRRGEAGHVPVNDPAFELFVDVLTAIDDQDMMTRYIGDSMTTQEMEQLSGRLQAAYDIHHGRSAEETMSASGLKDETVERVRDWYTGEDGYEGYKLAFRIYDSANSRSNENNQMTSNAGVLFSG